VAERRLGRNQPDDAPAGALRGGRVAAVATLSIEDLELRDLGAEQGQERMAVVAAVLVHGEKLEAEAQGPEMHGETPAGPPDDVLVITKWEEDRNVESG
jgi:hypothetical protein